MGQKYSHLTRHERNVIESMVAQKCKKSQIAKHLGLHISTVYRELKRNSRKNIRNGKLEYSSYFANLQYIKRRERKTKLGSDIRLRDFVHKKLRSNVSVQ